MTVYRVRHLGSLSEFRSAAAQWDDLWQRAATAAPTARAELVAQWVEQFQPDGTFQAVAIECDGQFVAALPLVGQTIGGVLSEAVMTGNEWSACGDLLVDPAAPSEALDALVAALARLPKHWLWLDGAAVERPDWLAWADACRRAGASLVSRTTFDVGWLPIEHDFPAYVASLSRSHRHAMKKALRRLDEAGDVRFHYLPQLGPDDVEPRLFDGFGVEDRSWKGRTGTSVLKTPGMFAFFVRQAEQLAAWQQLQLASLELNGQTIAFLYGYRAKGVVYAHKIGYDPAFAELSPGQVMFYHLFEHLHADPTIRGVDFLGPLTESTSRWRPQSYRLARWVVAPRRLLGKAALFAYAHWWPRLKRLARRSGERKADSGKP